MSAPAIKNTGAAVSGGSASALQPAWPTHEEGDFGLLIVFSDGNERTLSDAQGFTQIATANTGTGTGVRVTLFGCFASSGAMTAPTIAAGGNYVTAWIATFTGVDTSTPTEATASDVVASGSESTAVAVPGGTTTGSDRLIVACVAYDTDTLVPQASTWANAGLTSVGEHSQNSTTNGNGGGGAVATGVKAAAGAVGNTTATLGTSSQQARLSIALRPEATSFTVAGTVTIGGEAAPDGEDVQIFADNGDGTLELVTTVQTTGGTGAFTASVPDNARTYFCKYDDGTYRGVSPEDNPA